MTGQATLARLSEIHAATIADNVAVVFDDRHWTWRSFHDAILRTVAALRAAGIGAGDRIAYLGYNSDCFLILLQACYRAGIILAPCNWRLAPAEIGYLLADSGARMLFADADFLPLIGDLDSDVRPETVILTDSATGAHPAFIDWIAGHAPDPHGAVDDPAAGCLLLYTSGTTGFPKGVFITHGTMLHAIEDAGRTGENWAAWRGGTVALLPLPFFHMAGSGWATHGLAGGAKLVVLPRPDVDAIVQAIAKHRVTRFLIVPAVLNMILNDERAREADLTSVDCILYGASPIPLDLLCRSMLQFPNAEFVQLYGATENCGMATWLPSEDHHPDGTPQMASCGKPFAGTSIRIVDEAGNTLPPHAIGEILIRSKSLMLGYWNKPDATAAAIADGWYRSGDAGYLDERGYLYISDRVKDMIVSGGENIYPAEIENVLSGHPAIRECAVIGVPDDRWGEAAKALAVLHPGASVTTEELRQFLRGRIADFKIPKTFEFQDELPRTPSGKILKRELREPYWKGHSRRVG